MTIDQLRRLLTAEVEYWSGLSYDQLIEELFDVVAYPGESKELAHQFEIQLLEQEPDYVHVCVSVDDGTLRMALTPLTHSFIVHRDGRVEK
jgi:hypothetical protein